MSSRFAGMPQFTRLLQGRGHEAMATLVECSTPETEPA